MLELLVALAAVALLLSISLPAIQAVRESGRRTECRSHLHQFGVALSAFEATNGKLPGLNNPIALTPWPRQDGFAPLGPYSAHFMLLPYLEQRAVYDLVDFSRYPPMPRTIRLNQATAAGFPVFLCPSDPTDHGLNYRLSLGPKAFWSCKGLPPHNCPKTGVFGIPTGLILSQVYDGLANTAMMSERYKSDDVLDSFSERDFWYSFRASLPGIPDDDEMISIARNVQLPPRRYQPRVGHQWVEGDSGKSGYMQLLEPNSEVLDCSVDGGGGRTNESRHETGFSAGGVHLARSFHPGGVNVLLADGSVVFINDSVDLHVWREQGTIGGPRQ